jgi:branched-chain amino acid transport system substrate-binding protein
MAYYAIHKHLMKAVMIFETSSDATSELQATTRFYTAHGGKILDTEQIALHQSSYRTEVAKAFATHPDVVFIKSDPQTGATLFSDVKELGHMNVPFISDDGGATLDFAKAMGLDMASKYLVGVAGAPQGSRLEPLRQRLSRGVELHQTRRAVAEHVRRHDDGCPGDDGCQDDERQGLGQ